MPGADKAVRIAEALDVTVEWLINGDETPMNALAREDAEWVMLNRFDFGVRPHEADRASPTQIPVRRSWIDRLGKPSVSFWAADMPAPGVDELANAGDIIICDYPQEHLSDRQHYIFLVGGVYPVVRLALVSPAGIVLLADDPRAQEIVLPADAAFGNSDNLTCVGRIAAVIQLRPL